MAIEQIEKDSRYTLACPESLLSGQGIGTVLSDYEIVAEGYLVTLLKDFLSEKELSDIDKMLDSITPKMF